MMQSTKCLRILSRYTTSHKWSPIIRCMSTFSYYTPTRKSSEYWREPNNKYKVPIFVPPKPIPAEETASSSLRRKFTQLRYSDGREHSSHRFHYSCLDSFKLSIPKTEANMKLIDASFEGPIFQASVMDEKWDIFKHDNYLYIVRSLNGLPCFKVKITKVEESCESIQLETGEIFYTSDIEETKDKSFVSRMVHYLLKAHLEGDDSAVVPLPQFLISSPDNEIIAYIQSPKYIFVCLIDSLLYIHKIYGVHGKQGSFDVV